MRGPTDPYLSIREVKTTYVMDKSVQVLLKAQQICMRNIGFMAYKGLLCYP